jgi:hypothetical protein
MTRPSRGPLLRRIALGAVGLGLVIATFVYFLPSVPTLVLGLIAAATWRRGSKETPVSDPARMAHS